MSSTASIDKLELPNGIRNVGGLQLQGKYGFAPIFREKITGVVTSAQTGVISITPTAASRYRVGGCLTATSGTNTGTIGFAINYVDSQGTTHTQDIMPLIKADGTIVTTGTAASKDWKAIEFEITVDGSANAISIDTLVTGSVNYTAACYIMQIG